MISYSVTETNVCFFFVFSEDSSSKKKFGFVTQRQRCAIKIGVKKAWWGHQHSKNNICCWPAMLVFFSWDLTWTRWKCLREEETERGIYLECAALASVFSLLALEVFGDGDFPWSRLSALAKNKASIWHSKVKCNAKVLQQTESSKTLTPPCCVVLYKTQTICFTFL